jgi:hypothetical protein
VIERVHVPAEPGNLDDDFTRAMLELELEVEDIPTPSALAGQVAAIQEQLGEVLAFIRRAQPLLEKAERFGRRLP